MFVDLNTSGVSFKVTNRELSDTIIHYHKKPMYYFTIRVVFYLNIDHMNITLTIGT